MSKKRYILLIHLFLLIAAIAAVKEVQAGSSPPEIAAEIRDHLQISDSVREQEKSNRHHSKLIHRFYSRRDYRPAWLQDSGSGSLAVEMQQVIRLSRFDGLDPVDYHIGHVSRILARLSADIPDSERLRLQVELDLMLTEAFIRLGQHLHRGKLHGQVRSNNDIDALDKLILGQLDEALRSKKIFTALDRLGVKSPSYEKLRRALGRYLRIEKQGAWRPISRGRVLQKGDQDERLPQIARRLILTGDLQGNEMKSRAESDTSSIFSSAIESAIIRFQGRHGLSKSGRLDRKTRLEMNVPLQQRILQIRLNMDLRRQLNGTAQNRFLIVNIPAMELKAVEAGKTVAKMRVIVGKPEHETPVFSDVIPFMVINPFWYIPPDIAMREILPAMKHDPEYLSIRGIRLFRKMSADQEEIPPDSIDWQSLAPEKVDFYFRQDPGWDNSLGSAKFIIPNRQHIYLHDTPARELFRRKFRALSFGCVRVEDPLELAAFMLSGHPGWSRTRIRQLMNSGHQRKISLQHSLPVHIVYWTVQVDHRNRLIFLPDIYGREGELASGLTG